MGLNMHISDLFFNRDFTHAKKTDERGNFTGWNHAKLQDEADDFLLNLEGLGVAVPSRDDLIADFMGRV